jgi:hypothetical protein
MKGKEKGSPSEAHFEDVLVESPSACDYESLVSKDRCVLALKTVHEKQPAMCPLSAGAPWTRRTNITIVRCTSEWCLVSFILPVSRKGDSGATGWCAVTTDACELHFPCMRVAVRDDVPGNTKHRRHDMHGCCYFAPEWCSLTRCHDTSHFLQLRT